MTLAEIAKDVFDGYAALDAPQLPADRWSAAQVRHHRWQAVQFGSHPATSFVLGVVEECCDELLSSLEGSPTETSDAATLDACADASIFATGLCTLCRLDFGTLVTAADAMPPVPLSEYTLMRTVGRLAHLTLKNLQRIRGITDEVYREGVAECVRDLWRNLSAVARVEGFDMREAYFTTLERVLARDFTRDPQHGGEAP